MEEILYLRSVVVDRKTPNPADTIRVNEAVDDERGDRVRVLDTIDIFCILRVYQRSTQVNDLFYPATSHHLMTKTIVQGSLFEETNQNAPSILFFKVENALYAMSASTCSNSLNSGAILPTRNNSHPLEDYRSIGPTYSDV